MCSNWCFMAKPITIKVIDFHPSHFALMDTDEYELHHLTSLTDSAAQIQSLADCSVQSGTFLYEGRILCCCGFIRLWAGVVEGWILPSVYIDTHPISYARKIRQYLDSIMETFNCHRIQSTAINDERHRRWMEFLGFNVEGKMVRYTADKRDFLMYARTR